MNTSQLEVTALTVTEAAAQLIANAPAPDSPKKPRTAVGLPSDSDRHYDLFELRACGFDAMAATIVHHIAYNTKRHKCAKAYTSSYWMEFFGGCSKKQARTAVKNALAATINDVPLLALSHGYFKWSMESAVSVRRFTRRICVGLQLHFGNEPERLKIVAIRGVHVGVLLDVLLEFTR